jgi:hypothetical protein
MRKPKHDKELERMAKELMRLPFNKNGTDKTWINKVLLQNWRHFSLVWRQNNVSGLKP